MVKSFLHVGPGNSNKENTTPYFNNDNWDETRLDINPNANPDIVASPRAGECFFAEESFKNLLRELSLFIPITDL